MDNAAENVNLTDLDKFQLFYTEAIMQDSSFPQINKIKPIFEKLSLDEFIEMVQRIFDEGEYELTQQFLYFLILFRDMTHIQDYINSEKFSINMLERFIIFTFGYCSIHDHSTERVIDEILFFLNNERLLDLALNSAYLNHDKLILFLILSKFDAAMLNRYFSKIKNTSEFIESFVKLPDEFLKSIISRNYHLFQYLMIMMSEVDSTKDTSADFIMRYNDDIKLFSRLSDILKQYREKSNLNKEKSLPFEQRDMNRLSFLVNMIRELPDPVKAVEYFNVEKVFIDDMEKDVVLAVVTDPLLNNIFRNYSLECFCK
ncbi:MAG: hypothetical protein WDA74_07140 [Spirochaetota bacterium]